MNYTRLQLPHKAYWKLRDILALVYHKYDPSEGKYLEFAEITFCLK